VRDDDPELRPWKIVPLQSWEGGREGERERETGREGGREMKERAVET